MTENQTLLLEATKYITHLNVHQKTDATMSQQESFRSMWFSHSPQAARYALFAQLADGRVSLT